jgi:ABC-type dipeptide/oligopeptide/nickel transport system ATPase component
MIAMALACEPKLLIADELTTALDVTIRRRSSTCCGLVEERDTALIMITHDLGVVAGICKARRVMYAGTFVGAVRPMTTSSGPAPSVHARVARERAAPPHAPSRSVESDSRHAAQHVVGAGVVPFAPRCRFRKEHCDAELPQLEELEPGHAAACFYPVDAGAWERSRLEESA